MCRDLRNGALAAVRLRGDLGCSLAIAAAVLIANVAYLIGAADAESRLQPGAGSQHRSSRARCRVSVQPTPTTGSPRRRSATGGARPPASESAVVEPVRGHGRATGRGDAVGGALPTSFLALSSGQLYEHMLLELLAGICTYLLLRRLAPPAWRARRPASRSRSTARSPGSPIAGQPDPLPGPCFCSGSRPPSRQRSPPEGRVRAHGGSGSALGLRGISRGRVRRRPARRLLVRLARFLPGTGTSRRLHPEGSGGRALGTSALGAAPCRVGRLRRGNSSLGGHGHAGAVHLRAAAAPQLVLPDTRTDRSSPSAIRSTSCSAPIGGA